MQTLFILLGLSFDLYFEFLFDFYLLVDKKYIFRQTTQKIMN